MEASIEKKLHEMPTTQLVKIVHSALLAMSETEQTNFIAKHIDARTSLNRLGANDPAAFMDEVERFCLDCLNGDYYSSEDDIEAFFSENQYHDSYYDDDWDYDEYFSNTEWANTFSRLFKLSLMYMQSGDFETGHESSSRLLSCLKEMKSSENFLGTDNPMSYISADWHDFFTLSYEAMFRHYTDSDRAIKLSLRRWIDFGSYCDEGFLSNVKDICTAERYILEEIRTTKKWGHQLKCFELLARLYERQGKIFDTAAQATALIECNIYFYLPVMEGFCENEKWNEAVETACTALAQIQPADSDIVQDIRTHREIRAAIQSKLADAYERLSNFEKAFETVKLMFTEVPAYALYKRARALAEKLNSVIEFLALAESLLSTKKDEYMHSYIRQNLLRDIYSYEGETLKMLDMANSQKIGANYYDRKYIAASLIYRAANNTADVGDNLSEYMMSSANQDGIADMRIINDDTLRRKDLLLHGAGLLRDIISFHIAVAARNRYAKAAYYMCVVRDIFIFLSREDEFKSYFSEVIQENSRRPALRDEMGIVYGKCATILKKRK